MELYHIIVLTVGRAREVLPVCDWRRRGDVVRPASVYLEKEEDDGRRLTPLSMGPIEASTTNKNEHDWWRCP